MAELELQRVQGDRRRYAVDGVGTLRRGGLSWRAATAEAGGARWRFAYPRLWSRRIEATDDSGVVVGVFAPRSLRRGGTLRWGARELELRPASAWRERYALAEGHRELATFEAKGRGRRPVRIGGRDVTALDRGLVLFATFVVRVLADDSASTAAVTSSTAATS